MEVEMEWNRKKLEWNQKKKLVARTTESRYTESRCWKQILKADTESRYWKQILEADTGSRYWKQILEVGTESRYWKQVLKADAGSRYWKQVLKAGTESRYWKQVLEPEIGSIYCKQKPEAEMETQFLSCHSKISVVLAFCFCPEHYCFQFWVTWLASVPDLRHPIFAYYQAILGTAKARNKVIVPRHL